MTLSPRPTVRHLPALAALLLAGCAAPPPPPAAAPAPAPVEAPPPPAVALQPVHVCVLEGGRLQEVELRFDPERGDTVTLEGLPFARAYPVGLDYAAGRAWLREGAPVRLAGREYARYGLPRVLAPAELVAVGDFDGVLLFGDAQAANPELLYVPLRPGCEFQPYLLRRPPP